ncbi:MAG: ribonuclease P protein component [Anaerolineae bacterium]
MLPKRYRLTAANDFRRVHAEGRSWSDRTLVLSKYPNGLPNSRFGFSVSRRVGNAVTRNRLRRVLREIVRQKVDIIPAGWDVMLIARKGAVGAGFQAIDGSVCHLLRLASLLSDQGEAKG